MTYLPTFSQDQQAALAVSAAIWRLTRPQAEQDGTRYWCAVAQHEDSGEWYLRIDPAETQPIAADADPEPLLQLLQVTPENERDDLRELIIASRGQRVKAIDLFPPSVTTNAIQDEEWPEADNEEI